MSEGVYCPKCMGSVGVGRCNPAMGLCVAASTADAANGEDVVIETVPNRAQARSLCGAPTRSYGTDQPCAQHVKGGGKCWRHRDPGDQPSNVGKDQTRRSISISGPTHSRLKAKCAGRGEAVSAVVERLVMAWVTE